VVYCLSQVIRTSGLLDALQNTTLDSNLYTRLERDRSSVPEHSGLPDVKTATTGTGRLTSAGNIETGKYNEWRYQPLGNEMRY
jgi:hypothetical protein